MYRISLVFNSPRYNLMVAALYKQLRAVFYPPQFYFSLSKSIAFVPLIFHIIRRGGFEALPPSTTLYFKGIHDCAPTMPQANFSFILYIFSVFQE